MPPVTRTDGCASLDKAQGAQGLPGPGIADGQRFHDAVDVKTVRRHACAGDPPDHLRRNGGALCRVPGRAAAHGQRDDPGAHSGGDGQHRVDALVGGDGIEDQRPISGRPRRTDQRLRIGRIQRDAAPGVPDGQRRQAPEGFPFVRAHRGVEIQIIRARRLLGFHQADNFPVVPLRHDFEDGGGGTVQRFSDEDHGGPPCDMERAAPAGAARIGAVPRVYACCLARSPAIIRPRPFRVASFWSTMPMISPS